MAQPPAQGVNYPDSVSLVEWDPSLCLDASKDREPTPSFSLSGVIWLLIASALKVSSPNPNARLTLQLGETQGGSIEGLHPLALGSDVPLQQSMLLQQVLSLHQVLSALPGQQLSLQEGAVLRMFLALARRPLPHPTAPTSSLCSPTPSLKL